MRVQVPKKERYKNPPRAHQLIARKKAKGKEGFAWHMEQGTGKTWVAIDEMAEEWNLDHIDGALIIAPNGVHLNWTLRELPKHMPAWVTDATYAHWCAHMTKIEAKKVNRVLGMGAGDPFRLLSVNIEAMGVDRARVMIREYLDGGRMAIIIDESSRIKNPNIVRSKFIHKLRNRSVYRRNLSGTPITQAPFDAWSQFEFLDPAILDEPSFVAFKAQYAEIEAHGVEMALDDNGKRVEVVKRNHLIDAIEAKIAARRSAGQRKYFIPQIIKRDNNGRPMYKNLDKLAAIVEPYSYRVLKADCLDIPPKTYERVYVELAPHQRKLYDTVRKQLLIEWDNLVTPLTKLTALGRARQVVCGYVVHTRGIPGESLFKKEDDNPRIRALLEKIEDNGDHSAIIWACYTADIDAISRVLRKRYGDKKIVTYHGATKKGERNEAIDRFEARDAQWFVGNQDSGGIGITLNAASDVYYYSNHFGLEARLQSEDRCHRDGQTKRVTYTDFEARNTIDGEIINSLLDKKEVADVVMGDSPLQWLRMEG